MTTLAVAVRSRSVARRRRPSDQSGRRHGRGQISTTTAVARAPAVGGLTLNPRPTRKHRTNMADSSTIVTNPAQGTIITPADRSDSDGVYAATLAAHAAASVERNQDSHFNAAGQQRLLQESAATRGEVLQGKFDAVVSDRANEREQARQFAELKAELAAMRAEASAKELATLRAELADAKAASRADANATLLQAVARKVGI